MYYLEDSALIVVWTPLSCQTKSVGHWMCPALCLPMDMSPTDSDLHGSLWACHLGHQAVSSLVLQKQNYDTRMTLPKIVLGKIRSARGIKKMLSD